MYVAPRNLLVLGATAMSNAALPPGVGNVSPEDQAAAFDGPAFTSNHFVVQPYGDSLRIAFLEKYDLTKPSLFRTAVSLQGADVQVLIDLLSIYAKVLGRSPNV
jgi:hypothetical protein